MRVLVIGSGKGVESQIKRAGKRFDKIIGVNQAAIDFGPVDIHVTLHPEQFAAKKAAYMVSHVAVKGVDEVLGYKWEDTPRHLGSGSSGLYAVKYALEVMNADEVVLAGVGMNPGPHYNRDMPWGDAGRFRLTWEAVAPRLRGKVRSLGGWTKQLLDEPEQAAA